MIRALLWKEWREQRGVMGAGLLLVVLAPLGLAAWSATRTIPITADDVNQLLGLLYALFLWPLFAAACGAGTVANEHARSSLGFLLSRPMSRWKIIGSKLFVAFLCWSAIVAGSMVILFAEALINNHSIRQYLLRGIDEFRLTGVAILLLSGSCLIFACAALLSNVMRRTMTVAVSAIVVALALISLSAVYLFYLDPMIIVELARLGWLTAAFAAIFVAGSAYIFMNGEMLRGSAVRRQLLPMGVGLLIVPVLVWFVGWRAISFDIDHSVMRRATMLPDGDRVIMELTNQGRRSNQIWSLPLDGGSPIQLTPRLSYSPQIFADGGRVLFTNGLNSRGFSSRNMRFGEVNADGSGLRWIKTDTSMPFGEIYGCMVSPDGEWFALQQSGRLGITVVSRRTGESRTHKLDVVSRNWLHPIAWTEDSTGLLLLTTIHRTPRHSGKTILPGNSLIRVDIETGGMDVLYSAGDDRLIAALWIGTGLGSGGLINGNVPLLRNQREDGVPVRSRLLLIHSQTAEVQQIMDAPCGGHFAVNAKLDRLVFEVCNEKGAEHPDSQIRSFDLYTGSTSVLTNLGKTSINKLWLNPAGDRVIVKFYNFLNASLLVDKDGSVSALKDGGRPIGWAADGRLIETFGSPFRSIRSRDLDSGVTEILFPRGKS